MKKVYNLLAVGALMFAAAESASARYWTYDKDNSVAATDLQVGKNYVFRTGRSVGHGAYWLLNGQGFTNAENFENTVVYTLEETGETLADGTKSYYLKRVSDDTYMSVPGNGQFYTKQKERAWKLTFKTPTTLQTDHTFEWVGGKADGTDSLVANVYSGAANNATQRNNGAYWNIAVYLKEMEVAASNDLYDLRSVTYTDVTPAEGVVIASATPKDPSNAFSTFDYLMGNLSGDENGGLIKGENYGRNVWVAYEATELDAKAALNAQLGILFGTNTLAEKYVSYERGERPGQFSADAYATLEAAYNKAKAIVDGTENDTDENIDSLTARLPRYAKAFETSGKPLTAGYYIVRSWRSSPASTTMPGSNNKGAAAYDDGAVYDASAVNPNDKVVRWSYLRNDAITYFDTLARDYNTAKFIWQVTPDPSNPGYFFFKNMHTGRYIGNATNVNQAVSSTENPEYSFNIIANPDVPGFFSFYSKHLQKGDGVFGGLHTQGDANGVVGWNYRTSGSSWRVIALSDEEVATLTANIAPRVRIDQTKELLKTAKDLAASGAAYVGVAADGSRIANSINGSFEVDGLVTDSASLRSPMNDPDEGRNLADIIDGQHNTFFHSSWHGGSNAWLGDHYLEMRLPVAEQELLVKLIKRINGTNLLNAGAPANVVFWGAKDEAALDVNKNNEDPVNYDAWKTQGWDSLASATFVYNSPVTINHSGQERTIQNAAGYAYAKFPEAYKYIRIAVKTRVADGDRPNGNKYFHASEVRVYRGAYDAQNAVKEAIPADVRNALDAAIKAAEAAVAADNVSDATLEQLRKAIEDYRKATPTDQIPAAIAATKALIESAQESTEIGYYATGAKDAATAAITTIDDAYKAIRATRQLTVAEIDDYKARIKAVEDELDTKLNRPANGVYYLRANSRNSAVEGNYIYAPTASRKERLKHTGRRQVANSNPATYEDDNIAKNRLGAFWNVEKVDTGYTFKNLFTNLYLAPVKGENIMTLSDTAYVFPLKYAKTPGSFNIVVNKKDAAYGDYIYANTDPNGNFVTWYEASGKDNSAIKFEATDVNTVLEDGFVYNLQIKDKPQIITLPVDLVAGSEGFYNVIGQDANNNIQLRKETGVIKAGRAYVYIPEDGNTDMTVTFYTNGQTVDALTYGNVAGEAVNGLVPVFENYRTRENNGIFNRTFTQVLLTEQGEGVSAGTGYFTLMPSTTETGDKFIPTNGTITAIGAAVILPNGKINTGIYNLGGVRFNNAKNLPAGVYVVNGKKVVVK